MAKKRIIAMGLMSGTSVDAIDASIVALGDEGDELLQHTQHAFSPELRDDILALIREPSTGLQNFTRVHYEIGSAFAAAAEKALATARRKGALSARDRVAVIGSHGQTVFHDPAGKRTLQIGETSLIAARTGITAVGDFRAADTAVGGEGAPLLPYYHRLLFRREAAKGVAVHNLGGISNFTYVGPKRTVFALDTGPANCLLDGTVQALSGGRESFDAGGRRARTGRVHEPLLRFLKEQPGVAEYRRRRAPKSTGRELFSPALLAEAERAHPGISGEDRLRTLAQFTVDLIVECYEREVLQRGLPLRRIVLAGGGAKNEFLLECLRAKMPSVEFGVMEDFGWSSQALESQAFARFAWLALEGEAITLATTTGARRPVICGKISPGDNWRALRK